MDMDGYNAWLKSHPVGTYEEYKEQLQAALDATRETLQQRQARAVRWWLKDAADQGNTYGIATFLLHTWRDFLKVVGKHPSPMVWRYVQLNERRAKRNGDRDLQQVQQAEEG